MIEHIHPDAHRDENGVLLLGLWPIDCATCDADRANWRVYNTGVVMSRFLTWVCMEARVRAAGIVNDDLLAVARAALVLKMIEVGRLRLGWPS